MEDRSDTLRGARFFDRRGGEFWAFVRRAFTKGMGLIEDDFEKPLIGICNTYSEFNKCHVHFRSLVEAVKQGVWAAGGVPLEFPVISLGEPYVQPTSMLYRNLMAMDVEEMLRALPMDGVVLLGGCDKTVPAQLMAAASVDLPAIVVLGGPMLNGQYRGQALGACTDCYRFTEEHRAGQLSDEELAAVEDGMCRSAGHCQVMGTASTMACLTEALGMCLPGTAVIPAPDSRRLQAARRSGQLIVELVRRGLRPSHILTEAAFRNAIRLLMAVGGSTNAVIHLIAIAGRRGIALPLSLFDEISAATPVLADVRPSGRFQMEEFFAAGGAQAVLKLLADHLELEALTVTGQTLGEVLERAPEPAGAAIRAPQDPVYPAGAIRVLYGSLAPDGALLKRSAASERLLRHRGPALVFDSLADLEARIHDPDLPVTPDHVLILRNVGPIGAPGMPEVGQIPIPDTLLRQGVRDMVRISDARISGTSYGTLIVHVAPEAAVGGPLGLVRTGDWIELDAPAGRLDLRVAPEELERRRAARRTEPDPRTVPGRGYVWLYRQHVLQAPEGCDFDFLRAAARGEE